jgi:hypothetical protein
MEPHFFPDKEFTLLLLLLCSKSTAIAIKKFKEIKKISRSRTKPQNVQKGSKTFSKNGSVIGFAILYRDCT